MRIKKLSAGDFIEARCTRCHEVLNHTIVAMVGEQVVRVECNTCRGMHNYHGVKKTKEPSSSTSVRKAPAEPRKSRKDPGAVDREEWEALQPAMNVDKAVPYVMSMKYPVRALVSHPVFGLGVVKLVIPPNKMEVLFQDGKKLLRCA